MKLIDSYGSIKSDIHSELTGSYLDKRKLVAEKLLDVGYDWAKISQGKNKAKSQLKKECRAYIWANHNLQASQFGFSVIFFSWILPFIINWIVKKILEKMVS